MHHHEAVGAPPASKIEVLPSIRQQPVSRQLTTLVRRYLSVVASDKSYIRLLIAFPLLLGIIPRVVPAKNGLNPLPDQPNQDAPTVLMVLILCACFMGMASSVREIVKERSIYRRERSIGLSLTAFASTETAIDPVCGMEVAVSEASIHLERDGELYYFCSEGCRDTFSAQGVPDGAAH